MKYLISIILIFTISISLKSQDLSGKWEGTLTQTPNKTFSFDIEITQTKGKIYGYSTIKSGNATGKFRIKGFFDGDHLLITETNQETSGGWCKKFYKLSLNKNGDNYSLQGNWNAFNCNNIGEITLRRKSKKPLKQLEIEPNKLSGIWTGTLYQNDKNYNFYYQINIPEFVTNGEGTSFIIAETNNGGNANHLLNYSFLEKEKKLIIEEIQIIYRYNKRWRWCVKESELALLEYDDKYVLKGKWWGNEKSEGNCAPGTIYLEKQRIKSQEKLTYKGDRKVNISKQIRTKSKSAQIKFWDHGKIDNDIISIYLNGKKIVDNVKLSGIKEEISIELNDEQNYFVFHAENLGEIPPNTASFEIEHDGKTENVVLNGDLNHSDAILFIREN